MSTSIQDCLESLPRTVKEARAKGVLYYFTGKPCGRGHVSKRTMSDKTCVECKKLTYRLWGEANPGRKREIKRQWKEANPDKCTAHTAKRRATKRNATPTWADQEAIKRFYTKSKELEQSTGVKHHVDHIYPLKSDFLCGLHVEDNLQILTAEENISKHNRTWPDQLDCQIGRGEDYPWWRELKERINLPQLQEDAHCSLCAQDQIPIGIGMLHPQWRQTA